MSEQESGNQHNKPVEGGREGSESRRRHNRRRNGKRRPDERAPGANAQGEQTTPTSPGPASQQSPPSQDAAQHRQPKTTTETNSGERSPAGDQAQRSGRNKRRRPDRNKTQQPTDVGNQPTSSPVSATPTSEVPDHNGKATESKPAGRNKRREKPEREPQGSVLQRRLQREAKALEDIDDELVPTPLPVAASTVDAYMSQLRGWQREVANKLRNIIRNQAPDAKESILWSQPVYSGNGPVVYIKAFSDHVNLGFWRGNELDDTAGRLAGELPTMRHVTIKHVNEVDRELFEALVRQAFKLDRDKGDATA